MTDRIIVYPGSGAQDTDFLRLQRYQRRVSNYLARIVLGNSAVLFNFSPVSADPVAGTVTLSDGALIGPLTVEDTNAIGSLPASALPTTPTVFNLDPVTVGTFPVPTVAGQWVVHVIYCQAVTTDTDNAVLYYENVNNPTQVWRGVNNSGAAQPTTRTERVTFGVALGTPALAGTQGAPAIPAGAVPAYYVTLAAGGGLSLSSVSKHPLAPFLPFDLNKISRETRNIVAAAGITPSNTDYNQFMQALRALFVQAGAGPNEIAGHSVSVGWNDTLSKLRAAVDTSDLGNLAFEAWVAANFQPIGSYMGALGWNPVQQGGGTNQLTNKVYIGWSAISKLMATVDVTDLGAFAFEAWVAANYQAKANNFAHWQGWIVPGTYSFTVPGGVTTIAYDAIGGGGAGGSSVANYYSGAGGGSAAFASGTASVNPGDTVTIVIGARGAPATSGTTGGNGGTTFITFPSASLYAGGGGGGGSSSPTSAGGAPGDGNYGTTNGYIVHGGYGSDGQASDATAALNGLVLHGGHGAASFYGGGGRAGTGGGTDAIAPGAGGGGGYLGTVYGGYGGPGQVILKW